MKKEITIPPEYTPERLDVFLSKTEEDLSRTLVQKLIADGDVEIVGKKKVKANLVVGPGVKIMLNIPPPIPLELEAENIPLEILFEDDSLVVISKPPGMSVHPAGPHRTQTLVNALLFHCDNLSGIGGVARPGIVHRLDKVTSGIIVAAKNDAAHQGLSDLFKKREVKKTYQALVKGVPKEKTGTWEGPIGRNNKQRKKMAVKADGKPAQTEYEVIENLGKYSLISFNLITGRTHQIRVHLEKAHLSVVGDILYGFRLKGGENPTVGKWMRVYPGIALHAKDISFKHPISGKELDLSASPPSAWQDLHQILKRHV